MAQLARFEITRQDGAGNPVVAATITLRKQGATVASGGPTSFTVDDPGGIIAGDTVNVYNADGTDPVSASVSVASITATNVTVGGGGFSAANNTRISPSTAGPAIFADAQGNEAKTLTTDSNGYASAWMEFAPYDVVSTGGSSQLGTAPTKVWFDVFPGGVERQKSNAFMSGTTVARDIDTLRALTSGDKLIQYRSAGTVKWYVDLNAALGPRVPAHNVAGLLTIDSGGLAIAAGTIAGPAGGLAITGTPFTITGSVSGITTLATSDDITISGAANFVRASRLMMDQGTTVVAGDFVLGAGWGTGGASVTAVTAGSKDTKGAINIQSGTAAFSANPTVVFTYKDGAYSASNTISIGYVIKNSGTRAGFILALDSTSPTSITWAVVGLTPGVSESFQLAWHTIG